MKNINENKIAAYIDGQLDNKEKGKFDEKLLSDTELLKAVSDTLDAKNIMDAYGNENLPMHLKDFTDDKINKRFTSKLKIVIKLLRNGIKEIEQNLSEGLIKSHAFATRGSKNEISSFHYSHREKDAVYDIFTYFETEKTVRIRFEIKDNRDKSIPATICVYKSGVSLKNVSASEGNFEMSSLEKGDYVFNIEHKDVLDPFAKPKSVELTITLN